MAQLTNTATVDGVYQTIDVTETSTEVIVQLNAVSIEKSADKQVWVNDDNLTYTIIARNLDTGTPGEPVTNVVVTDTIDPDVAALIEPGLTVVIGTTPVVNPDYTYDTVTGLLTVNVGTIPAGQSATITFQVNKK